MTTPCTETDRLARIETNVEWIKKAIETQQSDTKNIGTYKKLTWLNFIIVVGASVKHLLGINP